MMGARYCGRSARGPWLFAGVLLAIIVAAGPVRGDVVKHDLGVFHGVKASWWVVQELKDQFRAGWGFENTTDATVQFDYKIVFHCSGSDQTIASHEKLKPRQKKGGQWQGMLAYPCKDTAPQGATIQNFVLTQTTHLSMKDGSIRLSDCVRQRLRAVADAFNKTTGKGLVVTSGIRSVGEQAHLMFKELEHGGLERYGGKREALARQIKKAYEALPKDRRSKEGEAVVRRTIQQQVDHGKYVSLHLSAGAADVRTKDLPDLEVAKLRRLLAAKGGQINDETLSRKDRARRAKGQDGPYRRAGHEHLHVNFRACEQHR